jgi:hypothetical protein
LVTWRKTTSDRCQKVGYVILARRGSTLHPPSLQRSCHLDDPKVDLLGFLRTCHSSDRDRQSKLDSISAFSTLMLPNPSVAAFRDLEGSAGCWSHQRPRRW